jgi:hypothetical protein
MISRELQKKELLRLKDEARKAKTMAVMQLHLPAERGQSELINQLGYIADCLALLEAHC